MWWTIPFKSHSLSHCKAQSTFSHYSNSQAIRQVKTLQQSFHKVSHSDLITGCERTAHLQPHRLGVLVFLLPRHSSGPATAPFTDPYPSKPRETHAFKRERAERGNVRVRRRREGERELSLLEERESEGSAQRQRYQQPRSKQKSHCWPFLNGHGGFSRRSSQSHQE